MKRRAAITGLALALLVILVVAVCQAPIQPLCTLASLRRIDDYPLYVMHYYGDYGFTSFLERGIRPGVSRRATPGIAAPWGCTVFAALHPAHRALLGRNFDWHNRQTLLLFTDPPDGYASAAMVDIAYLGFPLEDPSWSDRRRLLDAPYWPFDGMNERGLAVGMMAVPHGRDDPAPGQVTISALHAIRLLLDRAATLDQAIALLEEHHVIWAGGPPVHYLIADAAGHSAVVEYVAGELLVKPGDTTWQVSTNFLLTEEQPQGANSPCWRYNRVYERLAASAGAIEPDEAMTLLGEVSQGSTVWSVLYGLSDGEIAIAMGRDYDRVHRFRLRSVE
ncbi:MAG: linear amide C-N hydrolase [Anaerolineae bacterium]|nr:linear amide C-N hydrolase [Anaerolineae bacterium]